MLFKLRVKRILQTDLTPLNLLLETNKKILDVGCGTGVLSFHLKQSNNMLNIMAIDNDSYQIEFAKKIRHMLNIEVNFILDNIYNLKKYKIRFDSSISLSTIHFCEIDSFINIQRDILEKNGNIIILDIRKPQKTFSRTEREFELWLELLNKSLYKDCCKVMTNKYNVSEITNSLEKNEFKNIYIVEFKSKTVKIDLNYINESLDYIDMLKRFELFKIDNIIKMINKETIKKEYVEELKAIIDNRYNKIKHDFLMNDINLNDYKGDLIEIFAKK